MTENEMIDLEKRFKEAIKEIDPYCEVGCDKCVRRGLSCERRNTVFALLQMDYRKPDGAVVLKIGENNEALDKKTMTEYETREKLIQIIESHAGGLGCECSCARGYERCENCELLADDILRSFTLVGKEEYSDLILAAGNYEHARDTLEDWKHIIDRQHEQKIALAKALMKARKEMAAEIIDQVRELQKECYTDIAILEHLISKYGMEVEE